MKRLVLIDETTTPRVATPYNTHAEAYAALRKRIRELFASPEHLCINELYLKSCFDTTDLDAVSNGQLNEFLSDLWISNEGSGGVWTNFYSSDRCPVSGEWPDTKASGNADTTVYETAKMPSGAKIKGRAAMADEEEADED